MLIKKTANLLFTEVDRIPPGKGLLEEEDEKIQDSAMPSVSFTSVAFLLEAIASQIHVCINS